MKAELKLVLRNKLYLMPVSVVKKNALESEIIVAKSISARTKRTIPDISLLDLREEMEEICKRIKIDPDDTQVAAVVSAAVAPFSIITGGPGTGKTTLAQLISELTDRPFYTLSAINSGVKEVRKTSLLERFMQYLQL